MGSSRSFGAKLPDRPHLVTGAGGRAGEIRDLRADVDEAFLALEKSALVVKYFLSVPTNATDADGIKTTFKSDSGGQSFDGTDFDGILAPTTDGAVILSPKKVTVTVAGTNTPADWLGGDVVVTGTDRDGAALSETVVSAAGAGTTTTTNFFYTVTGVDLPAGDTGNDADVTIGVVTDVAAIASITSATSAQILDINSEFNRERIGNRKMDVARRISFVFSNSASWITSTITLEGFDARGLYITDTIAVPNGGNNTVTSAKFFAQVTKISVPLQGGAAGTCSVGILNTDLGLDIDILSTVVAVSVLKDANDPGTGVWAVPTAGTVGTSATSNSAPYGKFVPNVAPDGVRSYVLAYLPAPT